MPRRTQQDFLDAGRDRFGDHLEVSELRVAWRRFQRRVLFGRAHPPSPTGRHRHQDDPPGRAHQIQDHLQGNFRRALLIGKKCGAHTFPYIEVKHPSATVEHEATTSKISDDQLFYARTRGISEEDAVSMIVDGFCRQVFRELPMEFAVEARKLLEVSLEGAIG